jgi:hypothetical protein
MQESGFPGRPHTNFARLAAVLAASLRIGELINTMVFRRNQIETKQHPVSRTEGATR